MCSPVSGAETLQPTSAVTQTIGTTSTLPPSTTGIIGRRKENYVDLSFRSAAAVMVQRNYVQSTAIRKS